MSEISSFPQGLSIPNPVDRRIVFQAVFSIPGFNHRVIFSQKKKFIFWRTIEEEEAVKLVRKRRREGITQKYD